MEYEIIIFKLNDTLNMKLKLPLVCVEKCIKASRVSCDRLPLLDQTADDTESIMDGSFGLLNHQFVGTTDDNTDRLSGIYTTCDLQTQTTHFCHHPARRE